MKHFPQFIQVLRAAWDGDRPTCVEQAQHLAVRLENEGDTAHARMLRFTLAALQNKEPPSPALAAAVDARAKSLMPQASAQDGAAEGERVALTFGEWEHEHAQPR